MSRAEVRRLVRVWQRKLALSHFDVTLEFQSGAELGANAEATTPDDYDRVTFVFADDLDCSDRVMEEIVVHEWLHAAHRHVDHVIYRQLEGLLHRDTDRLINAAYKHAMENFIDATARRFVEIDPERRVDKPARSD